MIERRKWTEEDDEFLVRQHRAMSNTELSVALNRTTFSISCRKGVLGIRRKRDSKMWSEEENTYLQEHYENASFEEMSLHLGRTRIAIMARRAHHFPHLMKRAPAVDICHQIYDIAKVAGGDPESLFNDADFVENFVGVTCERLRRGEIEYDEFVPVEKHKMRERSRALDDDEKLMVRQMYKRGFTLLHIAHKFNITKHIARAATLNA